MQNQGIQQKLITLLPEINSRTKKQIAAMVADMPQLSPSELAEIKEQLAGIQKDVVQISKK